MHTGVTIWTTSQSSHHHEAISKTSRWLLCRRKILIQFLQPRSPSGGGGGGVFLAPYCWLKHMQPVGMDASHIHNNAVNKTNLLKPFCMLPDQKKNNKHKSNEIRDLAPSTFPKIQFGLSQTQKAQKHKKCSDKPVFLPHNLKALCFSSLCDYLFICLLIYFSLPRVQRACV